MPVCERPWQRKLATDKHELYNISVLVCERPCIGLTNHYAADNRRLLMYLTGYHDDNQPTAMTVRKMNSTSI